jgi:hypothetical protein
MSFGAVAEKHRYLYSEITLYINTVNTMNTVIQILLYEHIVYIIGQQKKFPQKARQKYGRVRKFGSGSGRSKNYDPDP